MRHEAMPDYRLERFRVRRDVIFILDGDSDAEVSVSSCVTSGWPHDAEYRTSAPLSLVDGAADRFADIGCASSNGENE